MKFQSWRKLGRAGRRIKSKNKSKKGAGISTGKVKKQKFLKNSSSSKKSIEKTDFKLNLEFFKLMADRNTKNKIPAKQLTFPGVAQPRKVIKPRLFSPTFNTEQLHSNYPAETYSGLSLIGGKGGGAD